MGVSYEIPKRDASPSTWKTFLERRVFRRDSPHRIYMMSIWERARLYLMSQQWLEKNYTEDPTRTPFWQPLQMNESSWFPVVVQNEMIAPIQNEAARLFGAGSRPTVRADNNTPKAARAAKVGTDVLQDLTKKLQWTEKEYQGDLWLPLFGTWAQLSYLDVDYTQTTPSGLDTALRCSNPDCDFKLADNSLPDDIDDPDADGITDEAREAVTSRTDAVRMKSIPNPTNPLVPPKVTGKITGCLQCDPEQPSIQQTDESGSMIPGADLRMPGEPQPVPLESYMPDDDEARGGKDFFGRRMGEDLATAGPALRNISPYDLFPLSEGVEKSFETLQSYGIETIETLDYIRAHFRNGYLVKAESAEEMIRWHPVVGGSSEYFGGAWGSDPEIFANHARLRQWFQLPQMLSDGSGQRDHGTYIAMAGNVLLTVDDLEIESQERPGTYIMRAQLDGVAWELREKELFGISGSELIFSEQDMINTERAQKAQARHLFGSPKIMAEEGMDLQFAGFTETRYDSDIWYYRPLNPGDKPFVFSGQDMGSGWQSEIQNDVSAVSRTMGVTDVETGNAPKDISAASALMFLGEKASERRKPRLARLREFKRRKFKHLLELKHEFTREPEYYSVAGKNDRTSIRSFIGTDLMGQTNVIVEDEDSSDVRLIQREALKDGLQFGTIVPDTAAAKRRFNTILGLPNDINDDVNRQVERAQEEWIRYIEEGREPAVDNRGDQHTVHFQTHELDLQSEEAGLLKDEVDWPQIQLTLWGWEEKYAAIQAMEQQLKQPPVIPKPNPLGQITPEEQQHSDQMNQQRQMMAQQINAMPKAPELRITFLWDRLLTAAGIGWGGPDGTPGAERRTTGMPLLRFTAHAEVHYRISQGQEMAANAGVPLPAAPGGPSTPSGMLPGKGQPAHPGPGAGPSGLTSSGEGAGAAPAAA